MEMKEMVYVDDIKREILYEGTVSDFDFKIMNLGTHPTAYIKLPEDFEIDVDSIDIHGDITYNRDYLLLEDGIKEDGHFIGWDYSHSGDYSGNDIHVPDKYKLDGKKWTTQEIFEDVKAVIKQLQWKFICDLADEISQSLEEDK